MILGFVHQVQLAVFIKAIGMGYFLGIIFSLFMFFNAAGGKNVFFVFLRDISFFVISAFLTFMFALKYNSGMIRFYIVAGELMGFVIFYIFPGSYIGNFWRRIFSLVKIKVRHKTEKLNATFIKRINKNKARIRQLLIEKQKLKSKRRLQIKKKKQKKINKKYERNLKKITKNT